MTQDEYGHDQITTTIETPDGIVKVSTWRSFFTRAVFKWAYGIEHNGKMVGCRLFASKGERDEAAAAKITEVTP